MFLTAFCIDYDRYSGTITYILLNESLPVIVQ